MPPLPNPQSPRWREWLRRGSAMIWLSGAALALSLLMICGLVGYIGVKGLGFFWPSPIVQSQTPEGPLLGEITGHEKPQGVDVEKTQFRVCNRDNFGQDYRWVPNSSLQALQRPTDAVLVERLEYGSFIGFIQDLRQDGLVVAEGPQALKAAQERLPHALELQEAILDTEKHVFTAVNRQVEAVRMERQAMEKRPQPNPVALASLDTREQKLQAQFQALQAKQEILKAQAGSLTLTLRTVDGQTKEMPLGHALRIVPSNALGPFGKTRVYASRLWEFVAGDPRESNTEGGVFPAIFGTVMMVLLMSLAVVPLGVMAALFLREYARQGWMIRVLRIAVNNLAGVPSIVFGIFGLGFFVYAVGGTLDQIFFSQKLPTPTFGTGGILWAALTLALLTVPVVIVSTEEALAAVPRSQREASLALGATKWQTIWKVVLPGALPGILTGLVLAMARGAGEVAPLMLTGVVKLAPSMPLDGSFPFLHLDRKFMHLGFHIYDVGFQSPNSEAAKPMVFMTTLLLLLIVLVLNLAALRLRSKLRARAGGGSF